MPGTVFPMQTIKLATRQKRWAGGTVFGDGFAITVQCLLLASC